MSKSEGGKLGRPPGDTRPGWRNPRWAKARTFGLLEESLYSAAAGVLAGTEQGVKDARSVLEFLAKIPPRGLNEKEAQSLRDHLGDLDVTADAVHAADGPAKWAQETAGLLLGRSPHHHRDIERLRLTLADGPPATRKKFAADDSRQRSRVAHPGKFDGLTARERLFERLPSDAQRPIVDAVKTALEEEPPTAGVRKARPLTDYYAREVAVRAELALRSHPLLDIVDAAISELPAAVRLKVRAVCKVHYSSTGRAYRSTPVPPPWSVG